MRRYPAYIRLLAISAACCISLSLCATGGIVNCSVSFPQGVTVSQNTIYIPFRMIGRLIAVEAKVDTQQGFFFLDTGASDLLLNKHYFEGESAIASTNSYGVGGDIGQLMTHRVDTLFWDGLEIKDLQGHVVSLKHIEETKRAKVLGILGYKVFSNFEILIDYSIRQLIITRVDKKGNRLDRDAIFQAPVDSLDFKLIGHAIVIPAQVNGIKLKLALDTGAELNLLDVKVKRKVLDNFEILRRTTMMGAGRKEIEVLAGILYGVDLDVDQKIGMRTLLTRMWKVNDAMGTKLDGILGYEFLFDKRALINYKKEKLYFFEPLRS